MNERIDRAEHICNQIVPLLRGQGPDVQGVVLANIVALWLAGHHPALRGEVIKQWSELMHNLVPLAEDDIFGEQVRPEGWEKQ